MPLLSLILKTARCFVMRLLYDSSSGVCCVFRVDSSFLSLHEIEKGVMCVAMIELISRVDRFGEIFCWI